MKKEDQNQKKHIKFQSFSSLRLFGFSKTKFRQKAKGLWRTALDREKKRRNRPQHKNELDPKRSVLLILFTGSRAMAHY